MPIEQNLTGIDRCPQCSIANPLLNYRSHYICPPFIRLGHTGSDAFAWILYECTSCHDPVLAQCNVNFAAASQNIHNVFSIKPPVGKIIPKLTSISDDFPVRPRNYLNQAIESRGAPDGAVMLAGSSVDAMLKLKGYIQGSIYERINKAAQDHLITAEMAEWAHDVRLESNKPRHADEDDPHATVDDAERVIDFVAALGEFLFVLPARIARAKSPAPSK